SAPPPSSASTHGSSPPPPRPAPPFRPSLRCAACAWHACVINRQFRLLFAGQAVSVVGDALFPVALAFAVLDELDGTPAQLGLVLAAQTLPLAVLILAAGVWADRVNRRNVMIVSDAGRAVVQATLA